jgi:hypothetical protein
VASWLVLPVKLALVPVTSSLPKVLTVPSTRAWTSSSMLMSAGIYSAVAPSSQSSEANALPFLVPPSGHDDGRALAGECRGRRLADAG